MNQDRVERHGFVRRPGGRGSPRPRAGLAVSCLALAATLWVPALAQAADPRSSSGSSRPIMPGGQPAGTGLKQVTPGASMGPNVQRPAPSSPSTGPTVPSTMSGPGASIEPGQGTVKGSRAAPPLGSTPPGGSAGSRGNKDNRRGH